MVGHARVKRVVELGQAGDCAEAATTFHDARTTHRMDACKDVAIFHYLGFNIRSAGRFCRNMRAVVAWYAGPTTKHGSKTRNVNYVLEFDERKLSCSLLAI